MPISLTGITISSGMMVGDNTNVIPSSLDIYSWIAPGGANSATLSRDTTTGLSPAGGIPFKMAVTGTDPYTNTYNSPYWNLAPAAIGQVWRASVYVKASTSTQSGIFMFGSNAAGTYFDITASTENITTSWTLISLQLTLSNPSSTFVQIRLDGPNAGGAGQNIWWDQLLLYRIS